MKTKLIILLFVSSLFSASSLAIISKTKGNVKHKKKTQKQLSAPKIGMELYNNDYIETGDNGFAKYVYLDDGTQIKVHNNSEVYIRGEIERRSIIKQLKIDEGTVKFDVKRQSINEFTVITPTSVASVKGTSFWIDCNGESGDQFFGESGSVIIRNRESGEKKELTKNKVANSLPDGTLKVREITSRELDMLQKRESDVGESGEGENNNQEGSSSGGNEDEIRVELQDASGNQKTIIIIVK
jgi:hypothetical protein